MSHFLNVRNFFFLKDRRKQEDLEREERIRISHSTPGRRSRDLQEYGVTKKWVIITEISKEVKNNSIARINAYARQYVPRSVRGGESEARAGNGGVGGSY
jgi:hypothetical protein